MLTEPVVVHEKYEVRPLLVTPESIQKFWEQAKKFPTVYGHENVSTIEDFVTMFFPVDGNGTLNSSGLFWVVNEFLGVFYLTEIREDGGNLIDANAHYTFFDKRHRGRVGLVKEMLKYWFTKYNFNRLSAEIPNYVTPQARHFAMECGMSYEGKKRKSSFYKGEWFDVNLYGILRGEVLNGQDSTNNR